MRKLVSMIKPTSPDRPSFSAGVPTHFAVEYTMSADEIEQTLRLAQEELRLKDTELQRLKNEMESLHIAARRQAQ